MRFLYTALFYLILPMVFLRLLWRSRNASGYRKNWSERLGYCPYRLPKCIWVHAVSVGETLAAIPLIKKLQVQYPAVPILVTTMTPTGRARVKAALGDSVYCSYVPYDLPAGVQRFLKFIHPQLLVVMETELWPNLFSECKKNNIPIVVTNARLSDKSAKGYKKIASLTRAMLQQVTHLSSQGKADAERFVELGMAPKKITVTGNLKFDVQLPSDLQEKSLQLKEKLNRELIWVAASTHPSEEEIVLQAHRQILEKHPHALLIIVPRHPERFNSVAELIERENFKLARRSRHEFLENRSVYLSDTMGEMLLMYAVADVAFVAGSFAKVGGHNMLEAAVQEKPIVMGPELYNFAEISELLISAKGMLVVQNATELADTVHQLFSDKNYRDTIGKNALQVVEQNRGALQKQVDVISAVITASPVIPAKAH